MSSDARPKYKLFVPPVQMGGPAVQRRPGETPVEAARRRLKINHPGRCFNLVQEWPHSSNKSWDIEFWEETVFVFD